MPRSKKADLEVVSDPVQALIKDLKKAYPGRIYRGREYTAPWLLKRLPTGILGLDIALNGGLPAGGMTMVTGREGIGKNYIANRVIAHQQLFYGEKCNVAMVSTEMIYDKTFGKHCEVAVGFSEEEIEAMDKAFFDGTGKHFTDEYKEELRLEIGNFLMVPPGTAEELFDITLDLVRSRQFQVVVIDSFGSLLTEEDEEKSMEENFHGGRAALVNTRFARKMAPAFAPDDLGRPNMTCVIGINQVRDNVNRANPNSPMRREAGGWALKHARWVGIDLNRTGATRDNKKKVVGKNVEWKITKQKAGGHEGAKGDYDFYWGRAGIWRELETLRVAASLGVVKKSGTWYSYEDTKLGQGQEASAKAIEELGLLTEIEKQSLAEAGVHCNYLYIPPVD